MTHIQYMTSDTGMFNVSPSSGSEEYSASTDDSVVSSGEGLVPSREHPRDYSTTSSTTHSRSTPVGSVATSTFTESDLPFGGTLLMGSPNSTVQTPTTGTTHGEHSSNGHPPYP